MNLQTFASFISFARNIQPVLGDEAAKKIQGEYLRLRKDGQSRNTISVTPRQLESLIRMSEAFAKMRLSNEVSVEDAQTAIQIMNSATLKSATDPETGEIDMGIIATGKSSAMMKRIAEVSLKITELLCINESKYCSSTEVEKFEDDYRMMYKTEQPPATKDEIADALKSLESNNFIHLFGSMRGKRLFKLRLFDEH